MVAIVAHEKNLDVPEDNGCSSDPHLVPTSGWAEKFVPAAPLVTVPHARSIIVIIVPTYSTPASGFSTSLQEAGVPVED